MAGYYCSFLVTHGINFILSLRRLIRTSGCHLSLLRPVLAVGAMSLAVAAGGCFRTAAVSAGAYILTLIAMLTLLRVVGREDLRWLRGLVKQK